VFSHYYFVIYFFIYQDSTFKSQTIHSLPVLIFILLPKFLSLFSFYLLFLFRAMQSCKQQGQEVDLHKIGADLSRRLKAQEKIKKMWL